MAANDVYSPTTAPNPKLSWFRVPSQSLDKRRFGIKVCEVLLSLAAFILEEMIPSCLSCFALYFFEFVSCTAFLFTLLLLILLSTILHTKVGITCWPKLDFMYTSGIALLFFIASIVFASDNSLNALDRSAVAFGFLSTFLFVADVILFVMTFGFPFKKDGNEESSNGVAAGSGSVAGAATETERLNAPTSGTE